MKYKNTYFLGLLVISLTFFSCGKQRKNLVSRTYHRTTTLFNWYYNGERVWKEGVLQIEGSFKVPPEGFVPILYFGDEQSASAAYGNFDQSIEKAETAIYKHDQDKNVWIDNCRFLIGRNWFYKKDYFLASTNFEYIIKTWPKSRIIPDVKIWLAKTYFMSDRGPMARKLIDEEISKMDLKKRQQGELALLEATMLMKEKDYEGASKILQKNLKNFRGRINRARVHFFLAQMYAQQGKFARAYEHYRKVTRMNTDYGIIFNAKIQSVRLLIENQQGEDDTKKIFRSLKRMLRDDKNVDFQDQILYEIALLEYKHDNFKQAVYWLRESVAASTTNQRQKALSYYKAGQIYFYDLHDFTRAEAYFDSASTSISPEAPEYKVITSIGKTLKEYVSYTHTIHYQDSMVYLAGLSEADQKRQVERIKAKEKQAKMQKEQEDREAENRLNNPNFNDPFNQNKQTVSGFYFDSPEAVNSGRLEFQRIWGVRKNEDNWNRKVKDFVFNNDEPEKKDSVKVDSNLVKEFGDDYKYYKDIPKNEQEIAAAHNDIRNAMFSLGNLFDKKLELPDSAIVVFNKLIKRYPDSEQALKAKFALYNIYSKIDPYLASEYKDQICDKYPESIYCKLLNGEDVFAELNSEMLDFQSAYNALYATFSNKDYKTVLSFSNFLLEKYPKRPEIAQVLYLRGLSYGYLGVKDSLKSCYTRLVKRYPSSEQAPVAQRTLDLMNGTSEATLEKEEPGNKETGDASDLAEEENGESNPMYKGFAKAPKKGERVFVVMLLDKANVESNELKVKISTFNSKLFKNERLSTSIFFYQQKYHLAYISQFNSMELALNYINIAKSDGEINPLFKSDTDRIMFITPNNFKTAYGKKRFEDYYDYYINVILPSLGK
ncbi:MAG: tetratricopeptide repeat protein [Bacteroidia bacterium]|nr:tetratricopeptide repeat protein [Bacteroidia bacterium]